VRVLLSLSCAVWCCGGVAAAACWSTLSAAGCTHWGSCSAYSCRSRSAQPAACNSSRTEPAEEAVAAGRAASWCNYHPGQRQEQPMPPPVTWRSRMSGASAGANQSDLGTEWRSNSAGSGQRRSRCHYHCRCRQLRRRRSHWKWMTGCCGCECAPASAAAAAAGWWTCVAPGGLAAPPRTAATGWARGAVAGATPGCSQTQAKWVNAGRRGINKGG